MRSNNYIFDLRHKTANNKVEYHCLEQAHKANANRDTSQSKITDEKEKQ